MLYVSNIKYLTYFAYQVLFDPIYQTCHILYFLQHATVESQICHGTESVWHMIYSFFIPLSLSSLRQSHLVNSNPLLSNPNPHCSSTPHTNVNVNDYFHANANANLSLAMVFFFFF